MIELSSDKRHLFDFRIDDEDAVKSIYTQHFSPLCYYVDRIINNKPEAEDIVADIFIKMLSRKKGFDSIINVKSFLYVSARNASLNYLKSEKRLNASHNNLRYLLEGKSQDELLENEMIRLEVLQNIYVEIENLPRRCSECDA